jgi:hypothetical protein
MPTATGSVARAAPLRGAARENGGEQSDPSLLASRAGVIVSTPALLTAVGANTVGLTVANAGGPMRVKRRFLRLAVLPFKSASRTGHVTDVSPELG